MLLDFEYPPFGNTNSNLHVLSRFLKDPSVLEPFWHMLLTATKSNINAKKWQAQRLGPSSSNPHLLFSVSVSCFDSHQETHKASCASDKNHTSCTWLGGLCGCRLESAFLRPIRRHGAVTDRSEFLGSLWNLRRSAEVKFLEMRKTIDNSTMGICSKIKPKGTTIFVYIYDIAWLYHMIL